MNKVIEMQHINKKYYEGMENELHILHDIDLTVCDGEFVALVGESGSGKSTMMNIIGALDRPTSGQYFLAGEDISEMDFWRIISKHAIKRYFGTRHASDVVDYSVSDDDYYSQISVMMVKLQYI